MAVVASFVADVVEGVSPLTVSFDVTISSGVPSSFLWDFGDGQTSTVKGASHTYITFGYHTVVLKITDVDLVETKITEYGYIRVGILDFGASKQKGRSPLAVDFTNNSAAPTGYGFTGWDWNFGDGSLHSGETGPSHLYTDQGIYSPSLGSFLYEI